MKTTIVKTGIRAFSASTDSGHTVMMDSSPEIGGENKGPRPMEMLLMGLGGCTSIDVTMMLEKSRQKVDNCRVEISAERAENIPQVFTKIHVHFIIEGKDIDPVRVERAINLSAEKYCSASIMLGQMAEISHDFEIVTP